MAKKKPAAIATHAVIAGKKFLLAKDWNETKNVMSLIDDVVEVVDKKQRTGVVDIPSELFAGFAWTKHQMEKALKALSESGVKVVTLEFLPKEPAAAKTKKPKKEASVESEPAPEVPAMSTHADA